MMTIRDKVRKVVSQDGWVDEHEVNVEKQTDELMKIVKEALLEELEVIATTPIRHAESASDYAKFRMKVIKERY